MKERGIVLVVEDDEDMRHLLEDELREARYRVLSASNGAEALGRLSGASVDVLVTDQMMPGMKGRELLTEVRAREPRIPVVVITAFGNIESAVDAIRGGAYDYIAKPFPMEQLLSTVERALLDGREWRKLRESGVDARGLEIVAESGPMKRALAVALRAADAQAPVLLLGESGTGKELLARAIHQRSSRAARPFVAINCSAIPETLLESQLFGYRRGAFTDARADHRGLFLEADGGTLLLDEIGDMPLVLQGKLLRVLQEGEVHPLGAPAPVGVNVRVVAATHRDLDRLAERGEFRRDLYYRLAVIEIRIPPLRERPEDLLPLLAHFLHKHGRRLGREGVSISGEALEALRRHRWPGNIRELENVIERALVLGRGTAIGLDDLPHALHARRGSAAIAASPGPLADMEREHILRALRATGGNRAAAARMLGVDRKTLYRKIRLYRLLDRP